MPQNGIMRMRFVKKGSYPGTITLPKTHTPVSLNEGDVHELSVRHASFPWWEPVDAKKRRSLKRKAKREAAKKEEAGEGLKTITDPDKLSDTDALVISGAVIK